MTWYTALDEIVKINLNNRTKLLRVYSGKVPPYYIKMLLKLGYIVSLTEVSGFYRLKPRYSLEPKTVADIVQLYSVDKKDWIETNYTFNQLDPADFNIYTYVNDEYNSHRTIIDFYKDMEAKGIDVTDFSVNTMDPHESFISYIKELEDSAIDMGHVEQIKKMYGEGNENEFLDTYKEHMIKKLKDFFDKETINSHNKESADNLDVKRVTAKESRVVKLNNEDKLVLVHRGNMSCEGIKLMFELGYVVFDNNHIGQFNTFYKNENIWKFSDELVKFYKETTLKLYSQAKQCWVDAYDIFNRDKLMNVAIFELHLRGTNYSDISRINYSISRFNLTLKKHKIDLNAFSVLPVDKLSNKSDDTKIDEGDETVKRTTLTGSRIDTLGNGDKLILIHRGDMSRSGIETMLKLGYVVHDTKKPYSYYRYSTNSWKLNDNEYTPKYYCVESNRWMDRIILFNQIELTNVEIFEFKEYYLNIPTCYHNLVSDALCKFNKTLEENDIDLDELHVGPLDKLLNHYNNENKEVSFGNVLHKELKHHTNILKQMLYEVKDARKEIDDVGEISADDVKELSDAMSKFFDTPKESNPFEQYTTLLANTLDEKNKKYDQAFQKSLDKYGPVAFQTRFDDKVNRIHHFLGNDVNDKFDGGLEDALLDTAGYCILMVDWLNQKGVDNSND